MEIYDEDELSMLVDSLTNYSVSLNNLKSNIEKELVGNNLDKFKDDIVSIYSVDKEIKFVDKLRDKTLYFLTHRDLKTEEKADICQENVK